MNLELEKYIKPRRISIASENIYITDECTSDVYAVNKINGEIKVVLHNVKSEQSFHNFSNVIEINNKLVVVPFFYDSILEYDLKEENITNILVNNDSVRFGKYSVGIQYKSEIWMIPFGNRKIVKYDSITGKVEQIDFGGNILEFNSGEIWDNKLFLAKYNQPTVGVLDLFHNKMFEIEIPCEAKGFYRISMDEDKSIWLTDNSQPKLYHYFNGEVSEYELPGVGKYICKVFEENVYVFALNLENVWKIDKKSKQMTDISTLFEEKPNSTCSLYFCDVAIDVKEPMLWVINTYRGTLYRLNTRTMKVDKIKLCVPECVAEKYQRAYMDIFSELPHGSCVSDFILDEMKGIHDLEGYVAALQENIEFSITSWIKKEYGDRTDSTYGEKIYGSCRVYRSKRDNDGK